MLARAGPGPLHWINGKRKVADARMRIKDVLPTSSNIYVALLSPMTCYLTIGLAMHRHCLCNIAEEAVLLMVVLPLLGLYEVFKCHLFLEASVFVISHNIPTDASSRVRRIFFRYFKTTLKMFYVY